MKADRELKREIKRANGDGSRDAKFELIRRVKAACAAMSTTKVAGEFYEILHEHGRVPVALCVAATIYARRERLDYPSEGVGSGLSRRRGQRILELLRQLRRLHVLLAGVGRHGYENIS